MATINNPWVGYITRSYTQIKKSVYDRLAIYTPEVTDFSEGNPLVILVSIFAGIAEMLGYYIDNAARESYIVTAKKWDNVRKHAQGLDYHLQAAHSATADVTFTAVDTLGDTVVASSPITIAQGSIVKASNGVEYVTQEEGIIGTGESTVTVPVKQYIAKLAQAMATSTGASNQSVALGKKYAHGTAEVTINSLAFELVDSMGEYGATDRVFYVDIDSSGNAFAIFGNGVNGVIPPSPYTIYIDYHETEGALGNQMEETIKVLGFTFTPAGGADDLTVLNASPATSGSGYDTLETIRQKAPISIRTLNRAVTLLDYEDMALLVAGVAKSKVHFCCGKEIEIYVAPTGGGIATAGLLTDVEDYFNDGRKIVTTQVTGLKAGESLIYLKLTSTTYFKISPTIANTEIREALIDKYSFDNMKINGKIRLSDIYAAVDNLAKIDYAKVDTLYIMPYARPTNSTTELVWVRETLIDCTVKTKFVLVYRNATTDFVVLRNGFYDGIADIGVQYTDTKSNVKFTISAGGYANGDKWLFYTYPINTDIELDDYTVPVLLTANLSTITKGNYTPETPTC